ncbi:MAG: L,D-transpeptidase, partial [Chloroflexi bacterium]|nr:L,D-transpeptidase [Chloroflexota bacterium]
WHASPYVFISPWPKSSPFWYPRSKVKWVMHFHSEGYFIHDAPWEPNSVYGPGSENGPDASHGCVQVPHTAMKFLYTWTPNGTTVVIAP